MSGILPCYAANQDITDGCDEECSGKLESVFIEGHTDNIPIKNNEFDNNWELSAQRAIYTYSKIIFNSETTLGKLINTDRFPIFSVSGYGEGRPRNKHDRPTDDPANRRIDLRFIMTPPQEDIAPVVELQRRGL